MTRLTSITVIAALMLTGALGVQAASGETGDSHYTHAQLKQIQRDAHTPEQYSALATYYTAQQKSYLEQAAPEKQEWIRRSQFTSSIEAKYPRPVDSARNLYEYYTAKAAEAGAAADKYNRLMAASSSNK